MHRLPELLAGDGMGLERIPAATAEPAFALGRDAAEASREAGETMAASIVVGLGDLMRGLLAAFDPGRPSRLRTFDDVKAF